MIDLSHLTEEEQGAIMTVLRRDTELKKAEEERISKLEKILNSDEKLDTKWKYVTGEWFYEAKSRRHMDKIHGSEIILASMKQRNAPLEGSPRIERSRAPSSRSSDVVAPLKPARCLDAPQPREINNSDREFTNSAVRSPRMLRHNPFNRASLIIVEQPENYNDLPTRQEQDLSETEPISPLMSHPGEETSQTSGGSITSESSSAGLRPVPKKRTFLSRHTSSVSESSGQGLDAQAGLMTVVPAPRRSLQRGSSVSSGQSYIGQDEISPKSLVSHQVSQSAQPSKSPDETSQQTLNDVCQVLTNSILEREGRPPSSTGDRPALNTGSDTSYRSIPQRSTERYDQTQSERAALNSVLLHTGSIQESDRENSVESAMRQIELSLPQSTVDPDPPVSYDLNFIDMSDEQTKKSNQTHVFKLSTQTTSPTGDEDSIAKVLDWFSRSTDSSEWLNKEDGPESRTSTEKHVRVSKLRGEDSLREQSGDIVSDHFKKQADEDNELRAADRTELRKDTREIMQEGEEKKEDERQPAQVSHLKSFLERSKIGRKIVIIKAMMPKDKGLKPAQVSKEFDEEETAKLHGASDADTPVSGKYWGKGDSWDEREQELVVSPQKETGDSDHLKYNQEGYSLTMSASAQRNLADNPEVVDTKNSDTEITSLSRLSPQRKAVIQLGLSPEPESISSVQSNPPSENNFQSRETPQQEEVSKAVAPMSQLDTDLQTRDSPDSDMFHLSRNNSPYVDSKQGGNVLPVITEIPTQKGLNKDANLWDSEDKNLQSSVSPKRKDGISNRDRINSPHRQGLPHQESTADRIKQLKSFWEQERKPVFYNGKTKPLGDGKVSRGPCQAKLNKRFTKSEYDLVSVGKYSGSTEEDDQNFTAAPFNQRIEKSPLSTSRTQFNTLREFWDEATSDTKVLFSADKLRSPKRKEPQSAPLPSEEVQCGEPEIYQKTRPAVMKSSPPLLNRLKSRATQDGKTNQSNSNMAEHQKESKKSSKDFNREEKSTKPQSTSGKETRSPKGKRDSFEILSSRANSMRRAASMFTLSVPDENDQSQLKTDGSPIHSQNRRQRQTAEKPTSPRRSESPRARAYVPIDYRHYLGMTDKTSVHTSLAPAVETEGSEGKFEYDFDLGGPVRASTPVSSEERYSRKSNKTSQRPLWTSYSSSDTGQESSVSSTSDTWSSSRNSSNRGNADDTLNPVRKALRRAEARPKNLAKSMEDITASSLPRQERRQDPTADIRNISDASSIPSPSSSLFSDPDHLKKMSKSVPTFLQKEDIEDTDSNSDNSYYRGRLMGNTKGNSFTNSPSSTMSPQSSLSGSVMTMYGGDFGNLEVQGNIQFSINYIQKLREFHIFVAECQGLAAADPKRGRSDPYVKSYLVPDKANLGKRKTSIKKKTLNPVFNEILRYRVHMDYIRSQTLILSVWHHDTFGRNSFLGEVDVDLSKWDFDHAQMNYLPLKARTTPTLPTSNARGEMRLAVCYLPQISHSDGLAKEVSYLYNGEVHIWVKECKNLPLVRPTIDPYVKCFVLPDTSRKSRQKTRVVRRTADPVFNHTMVYDGIRDADLSEACVELTVWDRDRLASTLLGGLRLGLGTGKSYGAVVDWMDSTPSEVALWERMKAIPNEWVEGILPLRMLNSAKTNFK